MPTTDPKPQIASAGEPSKAARLTGNLLYLAAAVCAGGLFYLGWLLIVGRFSPPAYPTGAERAALQHLLDNAGLAFALGLWAMLFLIIIRWPAAEIFGWVVLAVGTMLYLGIAAILMKLAPNIDLNGIESPGRALFILLRTHSSGLICLGALRLILGEILRIASIQHGAVIVRGEQAHTFRRQCWELTFCQRALREHCPRFLSRVSCWKVKRGCFCNDEIANALLKMNKILKKQNQPKAPVKPPKSRKKSPPIKIGTLSLLEQPTCIKCLLYLEHQRLKYKMVAWFAFPLSVLITLLGMGTIRMAWHNLDKWSSLVFSHLALLGTPAGIGLIDLGNSLDLSWVMVVLVYFFIFSTALDTAEWLIFKKGL
jgi:hypothetical protein